MNSETGKLQTKPTKGGESCQLSFQLSIMQIIMFPVKKTKMDAENVKEDAFVSLETLDYTGPRTSSHGDVYDSKTAKI